MSGLRVSESLTLPLDMLTESNAVLAKKGAGKTNLGVVLVEEAHAAGVPVVIVDPKGDWYGIRSGADGKPKGGLPIPVFGGLHGDIPLEPTAGVYLADLVRERGLSVVLDVSEFESDAARRRFLTAFADRLYKRPERDPMHLMLEEAHEYIPQGVTGEDAKMVGVFARIVKQGRFKGIGVTMMTQRSASLNKNVLTQIDNLFMLRTGSPQDRAAVQAWVAEHGEAKEIIGSLPGLATGEFWLWQPQRGEPARARARMRSTYDAGSTPKIGEALRPPATLADVNLSAISSAMAATIEKAKADDPKVLRARIAELERTAVAPPKPVQVEVPVEVRVPVPVLSVEDHAFLAGIAERLDEIMGRFPDEEQRFTQPPSTKVAIVPRESASRTQPLRVPAGEARGDRVDGAEGALELNGAQRKMLTVLAQFPHLSVKQIAMRSTYSFKSSAFSANMAALRRAGYLEGVASMVTITEAGRHALGAFEALPTGRALVDHWLGTLKPTEANILRELLDAWPDSLATVDISERTGYSMTSSSFSAALASLKKWELASGGKDGMVAAHDLGEAASA